MYRIGASKLPWGTPARRINSLEIVPLTLTVPLLLSKKLESHLMMLAGNLESWKSFFRPECHTESKAFSASMKMATVLPEGFLLNHLITCSDSLRSWWTQDFLDLNPH